MNARGVVTLTTDFGARDPYAGQMKGAILSLAPDVQILDITHDIEPQAVLEAAFVLETSWHHFPEGSVHVVVVDPGVGTSRRRLIVQHGGHTFVGPDNGSLSAALPQDVRGVRGLHAPYRSESREVPAAAAVRWIEDLSRLPRKPSLTFEGRDVFGPVAALLANGNDPAAFGRRAETAVTFPRFRAPSSAGEVFGRVLRIDRFGNLITDILGEDVYPGSRLRVAGRDLPLARTYAESEGMTAIIGSSGYLEVALKNASAAEALGIGRDAAVVCVTHQ